MAGTGKGEGDFPVKGYDSEVVSPRPSWGVRVGVLVLSYASWMDTQRGTGGSEGIPQASGGSPQDYCK